MNIQKYCFYVVLSFGCLQTTRTMQQNAELQAQALPLVASFLSDNSLALAMRVNRLWWACLREKMSERKWLQKIVIPWYCQINGLIVEDKKKALVPVHVGCGRSVFFDGGIH